MFRGRGAAAQFQEDGGGGLRLALLVVRAHWELLKNGGSLWKKRRAIRKSARLTPAAFRQLLRVHAISAREVAEL